MARGSSGVKATALKSRSESSLAQQPRKRGRPSKGKAVVLDSEDVGWNDDDLSGKETSASSTRQVLRRVVIPTYNHSSIGSTLSSTRDQSSEHDTPATSAVATPAESLFKGGRANRRLNMSDASGKRKRSRLDFDSMVGADSDLARRLQEEEYREEPQNVSRSGKISRGRISNSEDDYDDDLLLESSDSGDEMLMQKKYKSNDWVPPTSRGRVGYINPGNSSDDEDDEPQRKKNRMNPRTSLPLRAARESASKALKETTFRSIVDSDDSPLSNPQSDVSDSDVDSDMFEDEHDIEDGYESSESGRIPRPPTASMAAASTDSDTPPPVRARQLASRRMRRDHLVSRVDQERAKLEKAHPEIKTMWETLKNVPKIQPCQAVQPDTITRKLKSFQLEGLDWMIKQEQSQWKGGLLGDEMGMGKTIQAVSLIMSDYPAKAPTLVVVPPVALIQWQNEIREYTNGKLKVLVYHNTNPKVKNMSMKDLKGFDVIMISYSGLESTYRKQSKGWKREDGLVKENSKIHAINYHRLILDEAHNIKSRTTGGKFAKACFALNANHKWCLSGTPVQNRIGEFFSLLRFLQVRPFACYFCKACKCAELHWEQNEAKSCKSCRHTGFQHVSVFNQELLNPITQNGNIELRREGLKKLRLITDRIMLRRMKRDYTASMELPPKEVIIHNEFFGEIERDFSSSIMSNTTRKFDTYVASGVMLNNYANIFGLIMQMRQVANHPDLILKKHAEGGQNVLVCSICDETAEEPIRSRCHHEFCRKCVKDYVRASENDSPECPRCHIPLSIDFDQPDIEQDEENVKKNSIINRIKMENWTSSTKIEMLVYDLYKLRSQKQTHKSIVFSQFTSMLQLVEWRLRRAGFNTVMLDGSMSPAQRQKSIEYFMENTNVEVFLVSLKAGGVALNLTEASRVFIIDPWWNPAAEWQSADRCHRIGQKRPCVITRLCIEDSVESRMVMLQEKKANMINGTINNDQVAMEKLTPEDMQFLFRGS